MRKVFLFFLLTFFAYYSVAEPADNLDTLIMDYPHGAERIVVKSSGEAYLYFGAGPGFRTIERGTFTPAQLYERLRSYLQPNLPRENRPDPSATYGMVTLIYRDKREATYLIYKAEEITSEIFAKANRNSSAKGYKLMGKGLED